MKIFIVDVSINFHSSRPKVSIWLQQKYKPYELERENQLEISSLYVIYFSFFAGLLSTLLSISEWIVVLVLVFNIAFVGFVSLKFIILPAMKAFWSSITNPQISSNLSAVPMDQISSELMSPVMMKSWTTSAEVAPSTRELNVQEQDIEG